MFCPECGKELKGTEKYCPSCGHPVASEEEAGRQTHLENTEGHKKRKNKKKWPLIVTALLIVSAAAAAGMLILKDKYEKQQSGNYVAEGNKYLEEMDYEKAEDSYLEAIKIAPKEKEPYLALVDLYLDEGEVKKAQEVISQAQEKVPASDRQEFTDIEEEYQDLESYTEALEEEIEADDIYYLRYDNYMNYPENELERQIFSSYAVVRNGDLYGIVKDSGEIVVDPEYSDAGTIAGYYSLHSETPVYSEEYGIDVYDFYFDEMTGQLEPAIAVWGPDIGGYKGYFYYYNDGLHNVMEAFGQMSEGRTDMISSDAIGVKQSDSLFDASSAVDVVEWPDEFPGLYAVYNSSGSLVTDFIYEECGSESSGLLAVEKDGKWGYVNTQGKTVIPLEYEASWQQYTAQGSEIEEPYCYAASEGYVPLVKDGVWEMRNTDGKLVIAPGVFEEIRPVFNGKCWAKKAGKWNVIELENARGTEAQDTVPETGQNPAVSDDAGAEAERPVYTEGPVEVTGVLDVVEWEHPNGSALSAYVILLDTPADVEVTVEGSLTEVDGCERIQLLNMEKGIDDSLVGKHVKVTGNLAQSPLTAYYLDAYLIWDAVVRKD